MEKEDDNRFLLLLQPNRDLAANWAVDVARELEIYLQGLSLSAQSHHEGSLDPSFNFAQAALLIQGSIQIYSRKVEYLYALVLQALDFIAHKKEVHQENCSIQADGKDADVVEDLEEEFLNLDDVPEEANIDLVEADCESSYISPAIKKPSCLLIVEGENHDLSGDIGELASYQISTSSLHRDFLLLDPCDAKYVDEYWKSHENLKARCTTPANLHSEGRKTPRSTTGCKRTPRCDNDFLGGSQRKSVTKSPALYMHSFGNEMDDSHDDDGGNMFEDEANDTRAEALFQPETDGKSADNQPDVQEDVFSDPWAPLNPHESGTLPVVPYRKGRPKKWKPKPKQDVVPEPNVSRMGKVWQALEVLEKEVWHSKQLEEPPPYEKLRSSFISKGSPLVGNDWSSGRVSDSEDSDPGGHAGDDASDHVYEPDFIDDPISSQDPSQPMNNDLDQVILNIPETAISEEPCLEALCQAQLDAILKKQSQAERQSEMANRVMSWKQKIEKSLAKQNSQPPFDIHVYGEKVLDRLSFCQDSGTNSSGVKASFTHIVQGLETHEVARTFAALLQLVNNGNVSIETGEGVSSIECFTAERPFSVKLLSCRKRHEEMLQYRAPSARDAVKGSSKKKGKGRASLLGGEEGLHKDARSEDESENHSVGLRNSSGKKGKRSTASNGVDALSEPSKCLTRAQSASDSNLPRKHKHKQKLKQKHTGRQRERKQSLAPIQVGLVS